MNDILFEKSIIEAVRQELKEEKNLSDEKAREIIIDEVYSRSEAYILRVEDISEIIERVFLKTRRKLGLIQPLIDNPLISEIMVNGPKEIFVEEMGKVRKCDITLDSTEELEEIIRNIVGDVNREINELNPIVDARLPDGSRVNGVYKNVAINGPILTIRKFVDGSMSMDDLINAKSLSLDAAFLLSSVCEAGYNIFISGGTSSGKTTLLNALCSYIPRDERVIVIEDSMELKLNAIENVVHMECRSGNSLGKGKVTMSELIKSSLRMRPDRVIVGEVRGEEVRDMLQAMNTGHQGSLSTGHANSSIGMLKRLETMYLSSIETSIDAIRSQISEGIEIMVHVAKLRDGSRKILEINELVDYIDGRFILNCLMKFDGESLKFTGNKMVRKDKINMLSDDKKDELRSIGII